MIKVRIIKENILQGQNRLDIRVQRKCYRISQEEKCYFKNIYFILFLERGERREKEEERNIDVREKHQLVVSSMFSTKD